MSGYHPVSDRKILCERSFIGTRYILFLIKFLNLLLTELLFQTIN